jgi:hypothetical protein
LSVPLLASPPRKRYQQYAPRRPAVSRRSASTGLNAAANDTEMLLPASFRKAMTPQRQPLVNWM